MYYKVLKDLEAATNTWKLQCDTLVCVVILVEKFHCHYIFQAPSFLFINE